MNNINFIETKKTLEKKVEEAWSNFLEDVENRIKQQKNILFELKNSEIHSLNLSAVSKVNTSNDDYIASLDRLEIVNQ